MKPDHQFRTTTVAVALTAALVANLPASSAFAQAPAPAPAPAAAAAASPDIPLSPEELEQLVARIALYPDDLVALVLPASTNPLQIVQAERYLAKRKADPKAPLDDKWDDSVKSLLNYPEVIAMMSNDLDWTAALGEAVVADQGEVLEAVQTFRRKTQAAGNLKTDPKQTVVVEQEVIKIVPTDPQVIYVPQYNPTTVVVSGGYSAWGYYPTPYPVYYYPYPPGAAFATGLIWGAAIGAAWNGGHWGAHYGGGNNNININRNTNINTGNTNIGSGNRPTQNGGSSQWKSSKQPGQVSKSVGATPSTRTGDRSGGGAGGAASSRAGPSASPSNRAGAGAGGGAGGGGVGGASTSRAGASASPSTRGGGGGGAFEGSGGSGRQAQMDSSRGASSRSSAGASSMSSGRGGGGGGRGGGGGGRGGGGRR